MSALSPRCSHSNTYKSTRALYPLATAPLRPTFRTTVAEVSRPSHSYAGESNMKPVFGADHFDKVAEVYDSRSKMMSFAPALIALAPPITNTSIVLDNACGPGVITDGIKTQSIPPARLCAVDVSPGMIETLRQKALPGVEAEVMDAQKLSFRDDTFTHSFTNMGIFLFPNPEKGAAEIYRTLKPGGIAVVTSIKQVGWPRIFQAAQRTVRPEAPLFNGMLAEEWATKEKLDAVLQAGGFLSIDVSITTVESSMQGAQQKPFVDSIAAEATAVITEGWSQEEKQQFDSALQEQIQVSMTDNEVFEIVVWAAAAKK